MSSRTSRRVFPCFVAIIAPASTARNSENPTPAVAATRCEENRAPRGNSTIRIARQGDEEERDPICRTAHGDGRIRSIDHPLTDAEVTHFLERGHVVLHDCFSRDLAREWTEHAYRRLGYDRDDPSTWRDARVHLPTATRIEVKELAPRAWAAACVLVGGEERIVHSPNHSARPRFLTNPPVELREPMCFNRPDPSEYSLVERAVLRALGVDRYEFAPTAPRERIVPERVHRQRKMREEEQARLAGSG